MEEREWGDAPKVGGRNCFATTRDLALHGES